MHVANAADRCLRRNVPAACDPVQTNKYTLITKPYRKKYYAVLKTAYNCYN